VADRSVVVRLRAEVAGFKQAMKDAAESAKRTGDQTEDSGDRARTATERLTQSAQNNSAAWKAGGEIMMGAGVVIGAGLTIAAKASMDFEAQLSGVQAASGATASEMGKLRDAALQAGADTVFSAKEAAQAETELAKAGISTADIMGGALRGSLDLAAAGQLELGRSAEISGQAMKIFNLHGKDVGHIADVLAAGANKSAADVETLAQAMQQSGLVAAQTGLHLEDTVGILSAFADNALTGSDAGTSLKTMLQRLNPQSAEAAALMKNLGLSAYDSQGNFVGLAKYAGQLQSALGDMTAEQRNAAMQVLFGSDAVRAANVLYKLGADGVNEYTAAVNDQGAASRTAAIQMDNLKGDIEQLQGSIETALIRSGSVGNDALRGLAQSATGAVNAFNDLPEGVQKSGVYFASAASGALLLGGAVVTLAPRIIAAKAALAQMGVALPSTSTALRTLGKSAGIAGAAFIALSGIDALTSMNDYSADVDKLTTSVRNLGNEAISTGTKSTVLGKGLGDFDLQARKLFHASSLDAGDKLNGILEDMTGYLPILSTSTEKATDAVGNYDQALARLVGEGSAEQAAAVFQVYGKILHDQGATTNEVTKLFPAYNQALAETASKSAAAAVGSKDAEGGVAGLGGAAEDAKGLLDNLNNALDVLYGRTFSVQEATDNYQSSLNDLSTAVKDNGTKLTGNSAAALDNRDKLRGVADVANDVISKMVEQGASYDEIVAKTQTLKTAYDEHATKAHITGAAVKEVDDYLNDLPGTYKAQLEARDNVTPKVDDALTALRKIQGKQATIELNYRITTSGRSPYGASAPGIGVLAPSHRGVKYPADGGLMTGPGGPRDDAIPAMVSNGEYVVKAAAVQKYGVSTFDRLNTMRFASGGLVGSSMSVAAPEVAVYVQSPVDGEWVRAQARVEIGAYDREQSRSLRSGAGRR
jgi:TP901 family phage tail tape measure protein